MKASFLRNERQVRLCMDIGGRLLKPEDRLQSIGKYFPYGEDRYSPNPANPVGDTEKIRHLYAGFGDGAELCLPAVLRQRNWEVYDQRSVC